MNKKKTLEVQNSFTRVYAPILAANSLLCVETGVVIELNIYDKMVYSYIHQQSRWLRSFGKGMFESQDSVARNLGFSRKTVNTSIKKLASVGVIIKNKTKVNEIWKTIYSTLDVCSAKFKLFAEQTYRGYNQKPVTEEFEIVVTELKVTDDVMCRHTEISAACKDYDDEEF